MDPLAIVGLGIFTAALGCAAGFIFGRVRYREDPEERERSEQDAERGNDADFVRLVRALPLGVIFVDTRARVRFANPAAGTIFDFDPARSIGSHIIASVPNVELERRIDDALRGEASVAPVTLANGDRRSTYRISVYPLSDDTRTHGVVVFADDQTEVVRLEHARKEFLSNVSHELRTPLSSIKLMLETVVESPDDEAADIFLPQVLAQVDRLVSLVGQLLDQARAESGQLKLNLRDVDLEEIAGPILSTFEPQASNKGVRLDLRANRPVRVEADPDRLAQVFVNLIDNALRHTNSGGSVATESMLGAGTVFTIRLPIMRSTRVRPAS